MVTVMLPCRKQVGCSSCTRASSASPIPRALEAGVEDVEVGQLVPVESREAGRPVADLRDDDLVAWKEDVTDPESDFVLRVQVGEVEHCVRAGGKEDFRDGLGIGRPGSPRRRLHSGSSLLGPASTHQHRCPVSDCRCLGPDRRSC